MLKAVDFFCGAGGVTCGFKQAKIDVLGGIDIDQDCKETYERNNKTKFLNIDVSNCSPKILSEKIGIKKKQDDLIFIGCSPCQYYSNITSDKKKSEKTRYLLYDFMDFVDYYKPGFVFIENVPGIETKEGSPLKKFKLFLNKNGYFFDEKKINARNFGVPQNRIRYVLIASRFNKISLSNLKEQKEISVKEAIGNKQIFTPIPYDFIDKSDFQHSTAKLAKINIDRLIHTPKNGGDKRSWPDKLKLESSKNYNGHIDVYGRMFWNKPSPTITTKFRSLSNGRFGHPVQNRAISLREGATLQSFPLKYIFYHASQIAIARMIGNAVPPNLAKEIGKLLND